MGVLQATRSWSAACLACAALALPAWTAPTRAAEPAPIAPASAVSTAELVRQMQQQMQQLRREVEQLRQMRTQPSTLLPAAAMQNDGQLPPTDAAPDNQGGGTEPDDTADPAAGLPGGEGPAVPGSGDNFPLNASYRYNAGGGYFHLGSADDTFTLNVQNLITLDGTFYDKASVNTNERGFNIPFARNYFFGNITKDWDYQIAFQEFLGSFNVLDMWLNYRHSGQFNVRFGRMLTPFLYEYYIFWPGFGPVITDSPLFQIAGHRQEGIMAWGRLFNNKVQYQQGIFNGPPGAFFNLDRSVNYIGALDYTPFKGSRGMFDSLGGGFSVQSGLQQYSLAAGATHNFVNGAGEPTTNNIYVNSSGVPFFEYVPTMIASGVQNRVAPHLYWYNQFSVLAEWAYSERNLANTATKVQGLEQVNGYYVTLSYFLTGEKYTGDGLSGFGAIAPNRPFIPSQHQYGPGAWELGLQYSQLRLGHNVVADGFADPLINATQLSQLMLGVNWYMNKYTRISFDWVNDQTNKAVPLGDNGHLSSRYNIYWGRVAMYF